jgi:hypothetical protein
MCEIDKGTKQFLQGTDAWFWEQARQVCTIQDQLKHANPKAKLHNDGLKNGASNKKYIHSETTNLEGLNARALASKVHESHKRRNKAKGSIAKTLEKISRKLQQYASVIDVFVQCNPHIACLIWGSIRVLLNVGVILCCATW